MPDEKTNSNHELIENYDDVTWLYNWWPMVKSNFKNLLDWVTAHINGTGDRHSAADIDYNSGTVEDGLTTLSNAIETGLSELADADAENCKYTIHQSYDVDISKIGSGNNVLYITIDGVNNYSQMSGKAVAINTGIYQCTFSSPSPVYVNVNGLGNKALRRPLPYDYADYDTKQYYTDKYCYGEIGRHQTLIVYYDGSNFILTNVAVPTKATKAIELESTDDSSYTTPKAVGVIAGKVKDDIGDLSELNTEDKTSVVNAINEKAPTSHASSKTTYGQGTNISYGHVKLSDLTSSTSDTSDGTAATPAAVKAAYDKAVTASAANDFSTDKKEIGSWSGLSIWRIPVNITNAKTNDYVVLNSGNSSMFFDIDSYLLSFGVGSLNYKVLSINLVCNDDLDNYCYTPLYIESKTAYFADAEHPQCYQQINYSDGSIIGYIDVVDMS